MPRRFTNLLLLVVPLALVATGLVAWALPLDAALPLYALHRVLGIALLLLLGWKTGIALRSLRWRAPRRDPSVLVGMLASLALFATLALGVAWSGGLLSFDSLGGYSALNVHVFLGLALVPLALAHLIRRWERRPSLGRILTRRATLRLLGLSAGAVALAPLFDLVATRRATGSKHAGSFTGDAMPTTIWTLDAVPSLDAATWRLAVGEASFSYADLAALPSREVTAVLDCTGGWWSEQRWSGVRVGDLLDAAGVAGDDARVVSVTGHSYTFPVDELREALLATHLGGEPLSAAHGHPARLVAPGRRGFQWIKWVARIEVA